MLVISTGFIRFSQHCPLFQQLLCKKAASDLERIECGLLVKKKKNSREAWTGTLAAEI